MEKRDESSPGPLAEQQPVRRSGWSTPFLRRNGPLLRAVGIFVVSLAVLLVIYVRLEELGLLRSLDHAIARATSSVLDLFGAGTHVEGALVASSNMEMMISGDCTGLVPVIVLASGLLAYPSDWRRRAIGIAVGAIGLLLLNMVRTVTLFAIGSWQPTFFDTAHYLVWQPLMILAAVGLWLVWVERYARAP